MRNFINKHFLIFTAVLSGFIFCCLLYNFRMWFLDDSYISMRYARNWATGNGLVFNNGERVEGYTNFLWVSLMAVWFKLNFNVPLTARVTGIIFAVFTLIMMLWVAYKNFFNSRIIFFLLIIVFVTQGELAVWANSGMETMLFTFLVTGSVLLLANLKSNPERIIYLAGTGFALSALTRPEGIIGFILSFFFLLFTDTREYCLNKKNFFRACLFAIFFFIVYLPYFLWRYNYFGWIYPNTYYAKVVFSAHHFIRGSKYAGLFILDHWFIFLGVLAVLFYNLRKKPVIHYFLSFIVSYLLYGIYVGGDAFPGYRFFMPVLPLLYLCFAYGIYELSCGSSVLRKKLTVAALIFCIFFQVLQLNFRKDYKNIYIDRVSGAGRKIGLWLRKNVPRSTVIALNPVGAIPYYSGLRTIDMLGLTDEYIAHHAQRFKSSYAGHEKGDGLYVLSKKPDIIVFDGPWGDVTPLFKADYEISTNPGFKEEYVFRNVPVEDIIFQCFVHKESIRILRTIDKSVMEYK